LGPWMNEPGFASFAPRPCFLALSPVVQRHPPAGTLHFTAE
jgi:hypothetical protein